VPLIEGKKLFLTISNSEKLGDFVNFFLAFLENLNSITESSISNVRKWWYATLTVTTPE
jgi:hypothetical protein